MVICFFPIRIMLNNKWFSISLNLVLTWAWLCRPTPTHQNNSQTPQVTGLVVAVILEYLWSCVVQGEAGSLQELIVWWFEASKAKVYDFYLRVLTLICEEQVLQSNWETRTAIIFFCSAKLFHLRAYQIGHQDLSDQVLLTHVRVEQFYSFCGRLQSENDNATDHTKFRKNTVILF